MKAHTVASLRTRSTSAVRVRGKFIAPRKFNPRRGLVGIDLGDAVQSFSCLHISRGRWIARGHGRYVFRVTDGQGVGLRRLMLSRSHGGLFHFRLLARIPRRGAAVERVTLRLDQACWEGWQQ